MLCIYENKPRNDKGYHNKQILGIIFTRKCDFVKKKKGGQNKV